MNEALAGSLRSTLGISFVSIPKRSRADLGKSGASELRRSSRTDRGDASDHRRGEALDFGATVPARAQLLHASAWARGATTRDLHRLADAPHARRANRRGLFILPGIVSIMALSYVYALWGNVPVITALFFGLKAAVLVIVVEAVLRIGKRALKTRMLVGIAAISFIAIFFLGVPFHSSCSRRRLRASSGNSWRHGPRGCQRAKPAKAVLRVPKVCLETRCWSIPVQGCATS